MTVMLALADSERTLWYVTLAVGLVVALVVAGMLLLLLHLLRRIQTAVGGLLDSAGKVAENTANIPQLEATAPGAVADRLRGRRPGRLHERALAGLQRGG